MLICVDGTGNANDIVYGNRMQDSFVKTIYDDSNIQKKLYYRGPDWTGMGEKLTRPGKIFKDIAQFWNAGDEEIFMTGYSRGGAIVIDTAALLQQREGISVKALFLFDAVCRSPELGGQCISGNVKYAYHALRMPSTSSRESFGNCGLSTAGSALLMTHSFYTTHGGMGGVPWGEKGLKFANPPLVPCDDDPSMRALALAVGAPPPRTSAQRREKAKQSSFIWEGSVDLFTNVTIAQESAGMQLVHDWMWVFLGRHRVV